jgi:pyruvate formate lyase activating enzyme
MGIALPLVCKLHRFAQDDGPGIRTTVFMKGCPLSCLWCHNPEAMRPEPEVACYPDRCILCGTCEVVCPEGAITVDPAPRIDRSRCTACGACADRCPATAIRLIGKAYPVDALLEKLLRDRRFFETSGGGVTFSGGEPTFSMDYLGTVLRALKSVGLHTAIQTCGVFDYQAFSQQILPFVDLIMFDIKLIDAAEHRRYTGRDNRGILENFRCLTEDAAGRVLPRVPLVPAITTTPGNLSAIASFLADLGYRRCDLLPYTPAGIGKRRAIGMATPPHLPALPLPLDEEIRLRRLFLVRFDRPGFAA